MASELVIMCEDCTKKEMAGKSLSPFFQDYTEYYASTGLEFVGCEHLSMVEKDRK